MQEIGSDAAVATGQSRRRGRPLESVRGCSFSPSKAPSCNDGFEPRPAHSARHSGLESFSLVQRDSTRRRQHASAVRTCAPSNVGARGSCAVSYRRSKGLTRSPPRPGPQCMFRSWRQSVRELGERVERLEGELGRLNMENADLKSQLKERGPDCQASVLEESRRADRLGLQGEPTRRSPKRGQSQDSDRAVPVKTSIRPRAVVRSKASAGASCTSDIPP